MISEEKLFLCAVTNPFVTAPQLHSYRQEWVPDGAEHTLSVLVIQKGWLWLPGACSLERDESTKKTNKRLDKKNDMPYYSNRLVGGEVCMRPAQLR